MKVYEKQKMEVLEELAILEKDTSNPKYVQIRQHELKQQLVFREKDIKKLHKKGYTRDDGLYPESIWRDVKKLGNSRIEGNNLLLTFSTRTGQSSEWNDLAIRMEKPSHDDNMFVNKLRGIRKWENLKDWLQDIMLFSVQKSARTDPSDKTNTIYTYSCDIPSWVGTHIREDIDIKPMATF